MSNSSSDPTNKQPRLLDQVRQVIRTRHYSIRTEEAYLGWIKRYILFHHKRHPNTMGVPEIEQFLTHLAVEQHVAASTQNQAFAALLFLYRAVLHQELDGRIEAVRAKKSHRLPVVLAKGEVQQLLNRLNGSGCGSKTLILLSSISPFLTPQR